MAYSTYKNTYDLSDKRSVGMLIAKVFGVMFLGLLITALVSFGVAYGFASGITAASNAGDTDLEAKLSLALIAMLVVSALGLIILSIVLPITYRRGKHSIAVPALLYAITMGVMLSTLIIAGIPFYIFGVTFGITSLIFGVMALLGVLAKGRMGGVGIVCVGLSLGVMTMFPLYFIFTLLGVESASITLYLVIYLAMIALILFTTMYDVYRIRRIAEEGMMNDNNVVLYSAFIIYTDFINIFIRVLRIVLVLFSNKR